MNVLLLSAGRRVELLQAFQLSLNKLGIDGKVFALDMRPELSAACRLADGCGSIVRATDSRYVDEIIQFCLSHQIHLVIPTIDTELLILADRKADFAQHGITVVISSSALIEQCRDKRLTGTLFTALGIKYPTIYAVNQLQYPCFCKPYDGSRSVGAIALMSQADLTPELLANSKNMFMEYVPKTYAEYTIDAYYNKNSELCCFVPRQRLEVRDGEINKGVTRKHFVYTQLKQKLSYLAGAVGCITLQVFANEQTGDIKGLEINPRFGGGFPLSFQAGAVYPEWLIREYLLHQPIDFFEDWKNNLLMLRYDSACWIENYDG